MRRLFAVLVVVACGPPSGPTGQDACNQFEPPCCNLPAPGPTCATSPTTCGDNVVETCFDYVEEPESCSQWQPVSETCDGSDVPAVICSSLGYYIGGELGCQSDCMHYDDSQCLACASELVECDSIATPFAETTVGFASSGDLLALATTQSSTTTVTILDQAAQGFAVTAQAMLPVASISSLVSAGSGWLAVSGSTLFSIDTAGDVETTALGGALLNSTIAFGASGSAIVVGLQQSTQDAYTVQAVIVAANGSVVVPAFTVFDVFESNGMPTVAATTDGTSFFVATAGNLARVTSTGTVASDQTGLPSFGAQGPVFVSWAQSIGWYVVRTDTGHYALQPFDATGVPVGGYTVVFPPGDEWQPFPIADGDDLFSILEVQARLDSPVWSMQIARFDSSGAVASPPYEFGVGYPPPTTGPMLTRFGANLAVTWTAASHHFIAILAPP
ncbi:MAG TPA: hypothetical protein VGG74_23895 [Kofleriaceae bacterium]|jgi:hypothetical protein